MWIKRKCLTKIKWILGKNQWFGLAKLRKWKKTFQRERSSNFAWGCQKGNWKFDRKMAKSRSHEYYSKTYAKNEKMG